MERSVTGSFDIQRTAEPPYDTADGVTLGRMHFDKQFHGPLTATSTVEMLFAGTPVPGSAGYVAIERVTGALAGRAGSFVLQHSGTMNRGQPTLDVHVVPDSGTGGLTGLSGSLKIDIVERVHHYTFEYAL